ncbi:6371_t:CDS:2 [Entrophospora sp. SA101]|nr:6371_t:CDS:2 [Entrophospora sp. SA101]
MDKITNEKKSKVVGEMVYNPKLQRWEGNESVLKDFDSPSKSSFLTNVDNLKTSHNGKIIVCPNKRRSSNSVFSSEDEEDLLARFDSDFDDEDDDMKEKVDKCLNKENKDESKQKDLWVESQSNKAISDDGNSLSDYKGKLFNKIKRNSISGGSHYEIGTEFDVAPGFLSTLLASERQHRNEITKWYPAAGTLKNEQRFGLRSPTIEHGFLYEIRNIKKKSSTGSNNNSNRNIEICKNTNNKKSGNISTLPDRKPFKYLIGPKGANLQEILETTGCTLELPPATDQSVKVIIYGPQSQLAGALQTVIKKANSIHVQLLDITDLHQTENLMKHSINVLKYLWNRGKLKKIESETGVQIVTPKIASSSEMEMKNLVMEFVGKVPEDVGNARKEVTEIIKNLVRQNLQRVKDAYGVEIIVPDEKEANPEILIIFEGREDDKEFSDRKKKELHIMEIMEKVKNELLKVERDSSSDFSVRTLTVPVKHHRHIIGPKGSTLNTIIYNDGSNGGGAYSPVSVKFGSSKSSGVSDRSSSSNTQQISDNSIMVKGPAKEVERIVEEINEKVEDAKRIENMKSFTAEFTIPAIYSSHIIGKGGSKIKFIRDNYNVRIDIDDKHVDKSNNGREEDEIVNVKIVGMKVYVEEARNRILDIIDKLHGESVVRVNIPPQYHASLIGAKGKGVRNLEVKHGVRIKFPKNNNSKDHSTTTTSISSEIDESSCTVGEEECGEFIKGGSSGSSIEKECKREREDEDFDPDVQKPYEVLITGGKRGTSEARSELLDLLHYTKDHDDVLSFTIPAKCLPHIAQNKILEIVKEFEEQATITMNINPKHHKFLIGPGGNRIKEIIAKAGGPEDRSAQAGIVKFPRLDDNGCNNDEVVIKGNKELTEKIKEEFEILIKEQDNLIVDTIKVPRDQHSVIIGRNGSQLRNIQNKFNVELYFPGSHLYNQIIVTQKKEKEKHQDKLLLIDSNDLVKIIGKVENIKFAKEVILSKLRYEDVFKFPCKFYSIINNNGLTSRKLRNEYHVIIEHQADERKQISTIINRKPIFKKSTKCIIGGAEENDDYEFNVNKFGFKIIDNDGGEDMMVEDMMVEDMMVEEVMAEDMMVEEVMVEEVMVEEVMVEEVMVEEMVVEEMESGIGNRIENEREYFLNEISWTLKGVKGQVNQAVKYLNELLEQAINTCTGYLSIPQIYHRHIIGRGGLTISHIRTESQCKIDVPKVNGDDTIVIIGSKENIVVAKNMIFEILINLRKEQNSRRY